ncbi:MAG: hypothetical protein AB7S50_13600 [Bacteroidales bacterium]
MIQDIIALTIVFSAITYTTISIIKIFINKNESVCNCGSCEFKTEIHNLKLQKKN